MTKKTVGFQNDWKSIVAKPETGAKKQQEEREPDPFYQKREDSYYGLFPSDAGEKYAFAVIPDASGRAFIVTDIATIKRFRFTSPKDGQSYFDNLKMPMDPNQLFDMSVLKKATSDPASLTDSDKSLLSQIKRHGDLIARYKNLQYCKEEGVNFGYSPKPNIWNNRLKKVALTAFFGVWTKWKGAVNSHGDRGVKLIYANYAAFSDKFTALLTAMSESHDEDQPSWYEDYFSINPTVKGILDVKMGSMKVGGEGVTLKLIKVGKDVIDDKAVGMTGPISLKDVVIPKEPENQLSHMHYYLGMKSDGELFHDTYADRFEEALVQLEDHVNDIKLRNLTKTDSTEEKAADSPF